MFHAFPLRCRHYLLLLLLSLLLSLPNLGKPSLWDIDEGNNAVAAREMMESGNWIVPTFNYHLRVDKPALLYWLQIAAYRLCGVDELAARLPSALAAILSIFLIYELTRLLFDPATAGDPSDPEYRRARQHPTELDAPAEARRQLPVRP